MAPENAIIFWVEDNPYYLETRREFLEYGGHTVALTSDSLESALSNIPALEKKGVNVAIVDGNLSEMDTSGEDGERIALEIKTQHPQIIVIGNAQEKPIEAADINCPKTVDAFKFVEVVTGA